MPGQNDYLGNKEMAKQGVLDGNLSYYVVSRPHLKTYAQKWSFIANYGTEGYEFWTATTVILCFVIAYLIGIIIQVLNVWIWGCSAKKLNNQFTFCPS